MVPIAGRQFPGACIFSGLTVAAGPSTMPTTSPAAARPMSRFTYDGPRQASGGYKALLRDPAAEPIPPRAYQARTVDDPDRHRLRHNAELDRGYGQIREMEQETRACSLTDSGSGPIRKSFSAALHDMFPRGQSDRQGRADAGRMPCAHYKPELRRRGECYGASRTPPTAEAWCAQFEENNRKWLKTTVPR